MNDSERILRQMKRERNSRIESELISEKKTLELYFANEKLHELATDLKDREQKTHAILNSIADGVLVTDAKNNIIMSNQAASKLFGYKQSELLHKSFLPLLEDAKKINLKEKVGNNQGDSYYELIGITKNNNKIPIELTMSKVKISEDELHTIYAIRNIAERKMSEKRALTQFKVTSIIAEAISVEDAIPVILKTICENLSLELAGFWTLDRTKNVLRCISIWHKEEIDVQEFVDISRQVSFKPGIGLPGRVWAQRKPVLISDVVKDPNFPRSPFASKAGLHNGFGFPIEFENEIVGVIEFFSHAKKKFDNNLIKMLEAISRQIGLFIERKHAQKRVTDLNKQLYYAARRAGMAEVATSVLHNIGNVLNSVNVTASILKEKFQNSELSGLEDLNQLFNDSKSELGSLLSSYSKGKDLRNYINLLAKGWSKEQKEILKEIGLLINHIGHIKNIVMMQQSLSGSYGLTEAVSISELLEDAIAISSISFERLGVLIRRQYEEIPPIFTDRVKLLQILINLIRNAQDALNSEDIIHRKLSLTTSLENDFIVIKIQDNGLGIQPENLTKIFSYGFTTKKEGHGYGLHISGISAQEMGGRLTATSEGTGKGATFTLTIPARFKNNNNEKKHE